MIVVFCLMTTICATDVNGRFVINQIDSSKLAVLLQINTNTGPEAMGGATIIIKIDTLSTSFNCNPVKNVDYTFHNFCGGSYSAATVTNPKCNLIWFNIDLPYNSDGGGTMVAGKSEWTDVATVYLNIKDPKALAKINWETESNYWGIYSDNNQTLWEVGQFEDKDYLMPVELASFSASLLKDNSVQLKWTTASSLNSYGFEVLKSFSQLDGAANNWEEIGFVENQGNSNTLAGYSFTDKTGHKSTTVKYRLKIIDLDGTYSFSDVIEVETKPLNFQLLQNYPNPFNPSTMIKWYSPVSSHQTLKVFDVLGNEVATLVDEFRDAGNYEMSFDADNLPANRQSLASGMYIYRLTTDNYTETRKMLLIR